MLSVVLPLFNGAETLGAPALLPCIPGLRRGVGARHRGQRIPGREPRDRPRVVRSPPDAPHRRRGARRGCAAADNIGAFAARGSVLAVLRPGRRRATGLARVDGARARVARPRRRCERLRVLEPERAGGGSSAIAAGRPAGAPTSTTSCRGASPATWACRREAFRAVGGFDEQLRGGDDVDLCWRIQLAGFPLHVEPDAVVAKRRRSTVRGVWEQHFNYGVHDVILFRKFRGDEHAAQTRPRAATLGVARGPPPRPRSRPNDGTRGCGWRPASRVGSSDRCASARSTSDERRSATRRARGRRWLVE